MKKAFIGLAIFASLPVAYVTGPLYLPQIVSDYVYLSSSTRQALYTQLEQNRLERERISKR